MVTVTHPHPGCVRKHTPKCCGLQGHPVTRPVGRRRTSPRGEVGDEARLGDGRTGPPPGPPAERGGGDMLAGRGDPARLPPEPSSPVAPQALAEDARFREAGRGFSSLGLRRRGRPRGPWRASGRGGGCAFRHGHRQPTRLAPAPLQGPSQSGKCHTSTGACLISRETNFILCAVAAVDLRLRPTNSRLPEPSERSSRRLPTQVAPCDPAPHSANATVKPAVAPAPSPPSRRPQRLRCHGRHRHARHTRGRPRWPASSCFPDCPVLHAPRSLTQREGRTGEPRQSQNFIRPLNFHG